MNPLNITVVHKIKNLLSQMYIIPHTIMNQSYILQKKMKDWKLLYKVY
jgi:hypothetical protein